jgi:hypothetical protein
MGKPYGIGNPVTRWLQLFGYRILLLYENDGSNTGVAQLVEHWSPKPGVGRSSRSSRAN